MVILSENMLRNINQRTMRISNLIKRLEHIRDNEGDLNVYQLSDGILKMIDTVETWESTDGDRKICMLTL